MANVVAKTIISVGCHFSIPAAQACSVSIAEPGRPAFDIPTVLGATVWDLAPHPDGALVRVRGVIGKLRRLDSGSWSYTEVTDWHDLELAGVDRQPSWTRACHPSKPDRAP
jgi:hypothetical protein